MRIAIHIDEDLVANSVTLTFEDAEDRTRRLCVDTGMDGALVMTDRPAPALTHARGVHPVEVVVARELWSEHFGPDHEREAFRAFIRTFVKLADLVKR